MEQKKRNHGEEKRLTTKEETEKLLLVDFIREARYTTWLPNMVMVTKPNGKCRMCVDYTNLNKAHPKDSYLLLNIDELVDGAFNHKILSFLDAYSGYNQISIHPWDKEKTTFVMDDANYYYKVMSFSLKNAEAIYQWLIDDIMVKSDSCDQHIKYLEEVFEAIRRTNMRLNLEKSTFGVEGGKLLDFMLTHRGIKANPDKCQTITEMRSPQNIK